MGERERALVSPRGAEFRGRAVVMDAEDVRRATRRIAHEVLEHNRGAASVVLLGLQTGGVWFARSLGEVIAQVSGTPVPVGTLDVAYYRDDIGMRPLVPMAATEIPVPIDGAAVVLCDDVLFTGRTVRAALNALWDIGRPASVQLAVVVDRGHRELPLRPDYVGKNLPTRRTEMVDVSADGVVIGDLVASDPNTEQAHTEHANTEHANTEHAVTEHAVTGNVGAQPQGSAP
ncbi:MAG TPA: bifunctional pyr operon transcriptional regulator/uracil phosphoribosyltransferase PyrR [Acidimicrobiales bacterium]|nr:bifunctional pyr operon transcriptional regulator/uracil phosphoribosyltransferase PyrR [Acidimicrobiales bacterium]